MALPDVIPVRYSEEDAGYISLRPVVRQTFRLKELLDMILSVTGKDPARIQKILQSGTVVFHFYRYWWKGFEASEGELATALAHFPDPDPSRPFQPDACTMALLSTAASNGSMTSDAIGVPGNAHQIDRDAASHRSLLRRHSFWDSLLDTARKANPVYAGYSYAYRGDLYRMMLDTQSREGLITAAQALAPRNLKPELQVLSQTSSIFLVCPRTNNGGTRPQ